MKMKAKAEDNTKERGDEERSTFRAGIPKDWICPTNIPLTLDIKFCDMKAEMREYSLLITEYTSVQLFKG